MENTSTATAVQMESAMDRSGFDFQNLPCATHFRIFMHVFTNYYLKSPAWLRQVKVNYSVLNLCRRSNHLQWHVQDGTEERERKRNRQSRLSGLNKGSSMPAGLHENHGNVFVVEIRVHAGQSGLVSHFQRTSSLACPTTIHGKVSPISLSFFFTFTWCVQEVSNMCMPNSTTRLITYIFQRFL